MHRLPVGLIALSGFFTFGAIISALSGVLLLTPRWQPRAWKLSSNALPPVSLDHFRLERHPSMIFEFLRSPHDKGALPAVDIALPWW